MVRTTDSNSVYEGSNPSPPTNKGSNSNSFLGKCLFNDERKQSLVYMPLWRNRQTQRTFELTKKLMSTKVGNSLVNAG